MKLDKSFYRRENVPAIARELIGKLLYTCFNGVVTGGIITESEAYEGITDRASHAYGDRRTARTEVMYKAGGLAYIYLCYGMHSLFNVVTNKEGIPHAVLIRAIWPVGGISTIQSRTGKQHSSYDLSNGPGKVSRALGLHYSQTGTSLTGDEIWIEDRGLLIPPDDIEAGPRIGVDYAGEDAALSYRFLVRPERLKLLPGMVEGLP